MIPLTQVIMWYKDIGFLKKPKAFAMLDAMSEEINNNIYSNHRAIGMSSIDGVWYGNFLPI
jgi:hypothetical protein